MKLEVEIYKEKRDINVVLKDGMFTQHTVISDVKSSSLAVSRCISNYLKDSGFLN